MESTNNIDRSEVLSENRFLFWTPGMSGKPRCLILPPEVFDENGCCTLYSCDRKGELDEGCKCDRTSDDKYSHNTIIQIENYKVVFYGNEYVDKNSGKYTQNLLTFAVFGSVPIWKKDYYTGYQMGWFYTPLGTGLSTHDHFYVSSVPKENGNYRIIRTAEYCEYTSPEKAIERYFKADNNSLRIPDGKIPVPQGEKEWTKFVKCNNLDPNVYIHVDIRNREYGWKGKDNGKISFVADHRINRSCITNKCCYYKHGDAL